MREIASIHRESQSLRGNLADILKDMSTIEHPKPSATAAAVSPITAATPMVTAGVPAATPAAATTGTGTAAGSSPSTALSAASTIDFLQSVDVVKTRILRCAGTLEEVDRWSKRERLVDQLFDRLTGPTADSEGGALTNATDASFQDLARIHTELANMRSIIDRFRTLGVAAVESDSRAANLAAYGKKLDHVAQMMLDQTMEAIATNTAPLSTPDEDGGAAGTGPPPVIARLRILRQVYGDTRQAAFESSYQLGKLKATLTHHLLDKYSGKSAAATFAPTALASWLPAFLDEVVRFTREEILFAQQTFDDDTTAKEGANRGDGKKMLVADEPSEAPRSSASFIYGALIAVLHSELIPLLSIWLNTYLTAHKASASIALLLPLWRTCVDHLGYPLSTLLLVPSDTASPLAAESSIAARHRLLLEMISQPFERYLVEYATIEKKALFASLEAMTFGGDSYEVVAVHVTDMHRGMIGATSDALTRCAELTQGALVEAIVSSMSEYYTEVTQRLLSLLRRLRRLAGLDAPPLASTPTIAVAAPVQKTPTGDGLGELMKDTSGTGVDGAQANESPFASFQGAFGLLRACRALQWDLFASHADEALLLRICTAELIQLVRTAEEERNPSLHPPTPARRLTATGTSTSQVKSAADLSRLLAQAFLVRHPDRLKALIAFLTAHFTPFHTAASATDASHGTQGLHAHHPGTPIVASSVASPAPTLAARSKYGFPPAPNSLTAGGSASSSAAAASSHLFPAAAALFDSFISSLHTLILDAMLKPIVAKLAAFHEWADIWVAKASGGMLSSIPLPSFSMQPSEYVLQVGEHLLTLVQQMEPYVTKQAEDDDEDVASSTPIGGDLAALPSSSHLPLHASSLLAASPPPPSYLEHDALYWLDLLSKGTFHHLLSAVQRLTYLSDRGAKQLACDVDYLVHVLAALGVAIPTAVARMQVWLAWNEAHAMQQVAAGMADEETRVDELTTEERQMMRHLIKARRFKQTEAEKHATARTQ